MTNLQNERHVRVVLLVVKVGTRLSKRLIEKRVQDLVPPDHDPDAEWTIDEFLAEHQDKILKSRLGKEKEDVYFPKNGKTTNLDKWDLNMFCFILSRICHLPADVLKHVEDLRNMGNSIRHVPELSLNEEDYKKITGAIAVIMESICKEIEDQGFQQKLDEIFKEATEGPLSIADSLKFLHKFYTVDVETEKILKELSEEEANTESPEAKPISDLVKKAQTVQRSGDSQEAKRLALLAIAWADLAKHSFLNDVRSTVTAQQLANWYRGCSYVMNKIEENLFAARCFYNAIVFDSQWTLHNHDELSDKLGKALVYENDPNTLKLKRKSILDFLEDLDMLADLSEKRQSWGVCVAIDGDINKILNFLRDVGVIQGNVVERPGRKRAMFRTARCYPTAAYA